MSRIKLLQIQMMGATERAKKAQRSPTEVGQDAGEQQLGQLGAMVSGLTRSGDISDIPFTNDIAGGIESVYQGLPPGTSLDMGPLQMSAPEQLGPLDVEYKEAEIDASKALAEDRRNNTTTGKTLSAKDQMVLDHMKKTRPDWEEAFFKYSTESKGSDMESRSWQMFKSSMGSIFFDVTDPEQIESLAKAVESVTGYNVMTGKNKNAKRSFLKRLGQKFGAGVGFGKQ